MKTCIVVISWIVLGFFHAAYADNENVYLGLKQDFKHRDKLIEVNEENKVRLLNNRDRILIIGFDRKDHGEKLYHITSEYLLNTVVGQNMREDTVDKVYSLKKRHLTPDLTRNEYWNGIFGLTQERACDRFEFKLAGQLKIVSLKNKLLDDVMKELNILSICTNCSREIIQSQKISRVHR